MGTKPPAAVDECISMDGKHNSDAAEPHSTTLSSLQGRAGGSAFTPKLVELVVGPGSTRRAEKQSPRIACTAIAAPSVRLRVLVLACPFASMTRRGCRAPCSRRVKCWSMSLISSSNRSKYVSILFSCLSNLLSIISSCLSNLSTQSRCTSPNNVSWPDLSSSFSGGRGHCPQGLPCSPSVA